MDRELVTHEELIGAPVPRACPVDERIACVLEVSGPGEALAREPDRARDLDAVLRRLRRMELVERHARAFLSARDARRERPHERDEREERDDRRASAAPPRRAHPEEG